MKTKLLILIAPLLILFSLWGGPIARGQEPPLPEIKDFRVTPASPTGSLILLAAEISHADRLRPDQIVPVQIFDAQGQKLDIVQLRDDGVDPDAAAGDGIYMQRIQTPVEGGNYELELQLVGTTKDGLLFQDEKRLVILPGGVMATPTSRPIFTPVPSSTPGSQNLWENGLITRVGGFFLGVIVTGVVILIFSILHRRHNSLQKQQFQESFQLVQQAKNNIKEAERELERGGKPEDIINKCQAALDTAADFASKMENQAVQVAEDALKVVQKVFADDPKQQFEEMCKIIGSHKPSVKAVARVFLERWNNESYQNQVIPEFYQILNHPWGLEVIYALKTDPTPCEDGSMDRKSLIQQIAAAALELNEVVEDIR